MNPFRAILRLASGDALAKALNFVAFVYLARILGVESYGVLELAVALLFYFQLVADGGLEVWATRQAARKEELRDLVARIVPLRIFFAVIAFAILLAVLPLLPEFPGLRTLVLLFGVDLFVQAVSLKWVYMGRERMARVAVGLVLAQGVFAIAVFALVRSPERLAWVPLLRIAGDTAMAVYFGSLYLAEEGGSIPLFRLRGATAIFRPAFTMGLAKALSIANYNFDSVLLGFLLGPMHVGLYNAAYKPVTVALAMPVTFFLGLFPLLSKNYLEGEEAFRETVRRSARLAAVIALPLGVGGTFLAEPIVHLLFGPAYAPAVPALRVLSWSAVLVVLRGTYRQGLIASGRQGLDLRCAAAAVMVNVSLNLVLIPRHGIVGAAAATVASELLWLMLASYYFDRRVVAARLAPFVVRPAAAAAAMGGFFFMVAGSIVWPAQAVLGALVYLGVLLLLRDPEVSSWLASAMKWRWRNGEKVGGR